MYSVSETMPVALNTSFEGAFDNFDEFEAQYSPINHPNGETFFDKYGPDYLQVRTAPDNCVWTVIEGDDCTQVTAGYHTVNSAGYMITDKPWTDGDECFTYYGICDIIENRLNVHPAGIFLGAEDFTVSSTFDGFPDVGQYELAFKVHKDASTNQTVFTVAEIYLTDNDHIFENPECSIALSDLIGPFSSIQAAADHAAALSLAEAEENEADNQFDPTQGF